MSKATLPTADDVRSLARKALSAALLAAAVTVVRAQDERPNILFIFSDDHAVQSIGAYGSRINRTPGIDRIAGEGALFLNSFCGNSICAPSRATVLTGQHSHRNGKRTNVDRFAPTEPVFPERLRAVGYQTALLGKWHLDADPEGFDHWRVLIGQGTYYNPDFRDASGTKRVEGYATDLVTDFSIKWLEQRDRDRPFLLMCQHKAPHRTWAPALRHLSLFDGADLPEPASLFDDYSGRSALLRGNEMSIADHFYWDYDLKVPGTDLPNPFGRELRSPETRRMTPEQRIQWDGAYGPKNAAFLADLPKGEDLVRWKYQRYLKDYLRTVAAVDESVARLLDYLDREGLSENTIVVYSSDQGFYLGEHGWYDKRWMFEESFRMPLLMRWPAAIRPGTRIEALVQNIDYAPTFLDAAGVPVPDSMHGLSLLPLLRAGSEADVPWRDALYYAYYEEGEHAVPRHDGIRTRRYKLMFFPTSGEYQLFDLQEDPGELRSVHDDPDYRETFRLMRRRLLEIRRAYDADPWPLPGIDEQARIPRFLKDARLPVA